MMTFSRLAGAHGNVIVGILAVFFVRDPQLCVVRVQCRVT